MLGDLIKAIVDERGLSHKEFTKRLNRSRNFGYSLYSSESVKTGDLELVCDVLKYNFFTHLAAKYDHYPPIEETNEPVNEVTLLKKKLEFQEQENHHLKKIIDLLEGKLAMYEKKQ